MTKQVNLQLNTNGNYSVTDNGVTIEVSAAAVAAVYSAYAATHGKASKYPLAEMVALLSLDDPADPTSMEDWVETVLGLETDYPELEETTETEQPAQYVTGLDKVMVSGSIGNYTAGQMIEGKDAIIAYYRITTNEGREEPLALTDDQIWVGLHNAQSVLNEWIVKGLTDQSDVDVCRSEFLEKLDPATAPSVLPTAPIAPLPTRNRLAAEIGDRLAAHKYIGKDIDTFMYVSAERARMPTQIAYDLYSGGLVPSDTPKDQIWQETKNVILSMPRPGSKESDDDVKAMNANQRIWDFRGPGKATWYSELAMSFPYYAELKRRVVSNQDMAASVEYRRMSDSEIVIEKASVQKQGAAFVSTIKDAYTLLKQFIAIETKLKHITIEFRTEDKLQDDGEIRPEIIRHRDAVLVAYYLPPGAKSAKEKFFTRENLLRLDVDKIAKNADQWANLAVVRTPQANKNTNNVVIQNAEQFDSAMGELAALAEPSGSAFMSTLYIQLEKPESADMLASIFAAARLLDSICRRPSLIAKYREHANKLAEQAAKEAAEKQGKAA